MTDSHSGTERNSRVAVLGGGISGLAAAHALQKAGVDLVLYEASSHCGGVIRTHEREGYLVERGPDSMLARNPVAVEIAKELGIEDDLIDVSPGARRLLIYHKGRLRGLPKGFEIMAPTRFWPMAFTSLFSISGKFRMMKEIWVPVREDEEDESVASYFRRRLGQEALDRVVQPILGSIFGADLDDVSVQSAAPHLPGIEKRYGSLIMGMRAGAKARKKATGPSRSFISYRAGMVHLVDALVKAIGESRIRTRTAVKSLRRDGDAWVVTSGGEEEKFDAVIFALPGPMAEELLEPVSPVAAKFFADTNYRSSAVMHFAWDASAIRRSLNASGFLLPQDSGFSFFASTFSSLKFEGRAPEGKLLVRAFTGTGLLPHVLNWEDGELLDRVEGELSKLLGITVKPDWRDLQRWTQVMPLFSTGHGKRVAEMRTALEALPGLFIAGNGIRRAGIPDCMALARESAERVVAHLSGVPYEPAASSHF